jgi:hypothetical protein
MVHPALHVYCETFPGVSVNNGKKTQGGPIVGPICDKIITPHMVPISRPKTYTGAVIEP